MILAVLLSWSVVLTDCLDRPRWVTHYVLDWAERHVTGMVGCPTPEDPDAMCRIYSPFAPVRVGEVPQPPGAVQGDHVESPFPDCAPLPAGAVCYWITTAVDVYGFKSLPCGCDCEVTPAPADPLPEGYNDAEPTLEACLAEGGPEPVAHLRAAAALRLAGGNNP